MGNREERLEAIRDAAHEAAGRLGRDDDPPADEAPQ